MKIIQVEELMEKPFSEVTKKECLEEKETLNRLGGLREKFMQAVKKEEKLKEVIQTVLVFETDRQKYAINVNNVQRILRVVDETIARMIDIRKNKEVNGYIVLCEIEKQVIGLKVESVDQIMTVMLIEEFHKWKKTHLRESKNRLIFSLVE